MNPEPRPGTVRYKDDAGEWRQFSPHDSMYSMALFLATEFWDAKTKTWKPIGDGADRSVP